MKNKLPANPSVEELLAYVDAAEKELRRIRYGA